MSNVKVICGVGGCQTSFTVNGPRQARNVLKQHRTLEHPGWEPKPLPPPDPYKMDFWR